MEEVTEYYSSISTNEIKPTDEIKLMFDLVNYLNQPDKNIDIANFLENNNLTNLNHTYILTNLLNCLLKSDKYDEVKKYCDNINPSNICMLTDFLVSMHDKNNLSNLEISLVNEHVKNPININILDNLIYCLILQYKIVEATEYMNKIIEIDPDIQLQNRNNKMVLYYFGQCLMTKEKYTNAQKYFKDAFMIDKYDTGIILSLTHCLHLQKKYVEEEPYLKILYDSDSTNNTYLSYCGECLYLQEKYDKALIYLQQISDFSANLISLDYLCYCLLHMKEYNVAERYLYLAYNKDPTNDLHKYNLGICLCNLGKYDKAEEFLLKINDRIEYNYINEITVCFANQNKFEQLEMLYRDLNKKTPNDEYILNNLGRCLYSQKKYTESEENLLEAKKCCLHSNNNCQTTKQIILNNLILCLLQQLYENTSHKFILKIIIKLFLKYMNNTYGYI